MVVSASSNVQQARQVLADRLGELMRQASLTGLGHCQSLRVEQVEILSHPQRPDTRRLRAISARGVERATPRATKTI
jgi:hypothetical protein